MDTLNSLNPMEPLFQVISKQLNFPVDQIRYIVLLFLSYPLAYIFHYVLHPSHTSLTTRYIYSMSLGLAMGFMCFGWQMFILFGVVGVSYAFLFILPPNVVQIYTFVWAMGCMSAAHIYRIVTDFGGYHLDFTGPLMVMVQKITLVGFAYHDGNGRKESSLNEDQKSQKLDKIPSLLVYFSYNFNFHSLLAGPGSSLKEYNAFMDGSNFTTQSPPSNSNASKELQSQEHPKESSPLYPVVSKLIFSMIALVVKLVIFSYVVPDDVLDPLISFPHRFMRVTLTCIEIRCRYYFIWLLVDSINNLAGFGFNGYDKKGNAKWDLVSNVTPIETEFALSLRQIANSWNANASVWLRRTVFERVKFAPTLTSFTISAMWHGFYPGYFFCFISLGFITEAAKKMRRLVRPYFQGSVALQRFYDVITWAVTRVFLDFGALPLMLMWYSKSKLFWSYYYYIPMILACTVVFAFPSGKRSSRDGKATKTTPNDVGKATTPDDVGKATTPNDVGKETTPDDVGKEKAD